MPLGTEVDLGPGHIVLDWDLSPPHRKSHSNPPLFGPCLLWLNGRPSQLPLNNCCNSLQQVHDHECHSSASEMVLFDVLYTPISGVRRVNPNVMASSCTYCVATVTRCIAAHDDDDIMTSHDSVESR